MVNFQKVTEVFWQRYESEDGTSTTVPALLFCLLDRISKNSTGRLRISISTLADALQVSKPTIEKAIRKLISMNIIVHEVIRHYSYFSFTDEFTQPSGEVSFHSVTVETIQKERVEVNHEERVEQNHEESHKTNHKETLNESHNTDNGMDTTQNELLSFLNIADETDSNFVKKINNNNINNINNINNNNINNNNINNKIQDNPIKQGLSQNLQANPEIIPPWKAKLNKYERDIVDTWETVIGEFNPEWVPKVKQVLQACYPMQIKNAITTMARTKGEVMMTEGFPYLAEPLLKGAFGKRTVTKPKKSKTGSPFLDNKIGGLLTFMEEERKRKQQEQEKAGGG